MAAGKAPRAEYGVRAGSQARNDRRTAKYEIRPCDSLEELRACVSLQKEVWEFTDAELVPLRMLVVAQKIGGQVIGAFLDGELAAFALAIPGIRAGHSYLHSQMLAVGKKHREAGLGRRLKWLQREDALQRGIELIEWTFDPLEIKNAYLNIEKLGAIARRYSVNQYGITSSPLQGGMPTDRLIAEWWLRSKRVRNLLATGNLAAYETKKAILVPAEIYQWKAEAATRDRARAVQDTNRAVFLEAFKQRLSVLGFKRDADGNGTFLLSSWDEDWGYKSR
jgi:predicted GNAT superfamily acetyltransferase